MIASRSALTIPACLLLAASAGPPPSGAPASPATTAGRPLQPKGEAAIQVSLGLTVAGKTMSIDP